MQDINKKWDKKVKAFKDKTLGLHYHDGVPTGTKNILGI